MILVDTGPLVALFDPKDPDHDGARSAFETIREPALTTVAVLTEAFHLLGPASQGGKALRAMIETHGLGVHFLDAPSLSRAFELMDRWADRSMDLADASLVVAAESRRTVRVFTLDRDDFATYRARIGRTWRTFVVIDPAR